MKAIKTILILLILVAMPAASWYFLRTGLDWRKGKMKELAKKERFITAYNFTNNDKDKLYELTAHRTTLVKMGGDMTELDQSILDQFKNAYTFIFLNMSKTDVPQGWSSKSKERYYKPEIVVQNPNVFNGLDYAIVDTTGFIRQVYDGTDKETMTRIVEDLAVVLPRKKTKDIAIKKEK